jgi:hypothetical protein
VNDIDVFGELLDSARHDMIVQRAGVPQQPVADAKLPSCKRWLNSCAGRNRPVKNALKHQEVTSRRQSIHLLPGRITNPVGPQLVQKAVQGPNAFFVTSHCQARGDSRINFGLVNGLPIYLLL